MFRSTKYALAALLSLSMLAPAVSMANELPEDGPLADGELSEEEVAVVLGTAQQQLIRLSEAATEAYERVIKNDDPGTPAAWMLMKDGETIKRIDIDDQAQDIPAAARIKMYRAAIKSIARRGHISAAAILYTGRANEQSDTRVLVIEHEHRLGVSANKVIGYEAGNGKISWAESVTRKKPFEWFYDDKEGNS
jgi:hypothetical protein